MVTTSESGGWRIREMFNLRQSLAWNLLLLTIFMVFFVPKAFPVLILLPLLAVLLVPPQTKQVQPKVKQTSGIGYLIPASWMVAMLVIAVAKWMLPAEQFPFTFVIIIALIATVSAMLLLFWQWPRRYNEMLEKHNLLPGQKKEQTRPFLEEGSKALEGLLTDVEGGTATQTELLTQLEQHTQHLALLNEIGSVLFSFRTLTEAQERISMLARQLFDSTAGALCVKSCDNKSIRTIATWGELSMEGQFLPDECCALRNGDKHLFSGPEHGTAFCEHLHDTGMTDYLCIPLKVPGQTIGVLHLRAPLGETLSPATQQLAEMAAEQIALVLANLKLQENLRLQAVRDPLTNLYNREYMEESLKQQVQKAKESHASMGIMMLDVDHLQEFNNLFGYKKGDELLRQLGVFLQSTIRGGDLACRYGDDKFVLILPGASLEVTQQRAEQLRKGIHNLNVQEYCCPSKQVTLSLGLVSFPEHGENEKTLIRTARSALARAKAIGGSHVVVG